MRDPAREAGLDPALRELVPAAEPELSSRAPAAPGAKPRPAIPVAETLLDGNERRYVLECIDGNWVSSAGPFVGRFERAFADRMGCRHAVSCSSGTAALHLALAAAGVGRGDEVIVPAFTMISTVNAVVYLGATPVLVDSEPDTGNLDPALIGDALTASTKAIVPVHIYGHPVEIDPIRELAAERGLLVIEDAAEAHGASLRGKPVGSLGDAAAFSFYANKVITTGEGGMVTTDDERLAERARELRDIGFGTGRHFWHRSVAYNYRMSNLQAAVGLAQTERLDELVERRRENRRRYSERLAAVPGLRLPIERPGARSVFWMYATRVSEAFARSRDELRGDLAGAGIETRSFFVPMHAQPAHAARFSGERYPVAEELARTGLYLPSGPALTDDEIDYIATTIIEAAG